MSNGLNSSQSSIPEKNQHDSPAYGADVAPHTLSAEKVLGHYNVNPTWGHSEDEAKTLLAQNGPNELRPPKKPSRMKIFMRQILNAMTLVLIAAMAVSFGTMDWIAAGVIFLLVALNVSVGYSQEWKAEQTLAALQSVGSPLAKVVRYKPTERKSNREGQTISIPSEEVVEGDIIIVKIGDVVPADARIIPEFLSNLEVDEALLTGESLPVGKTSDPLDEKDCPVGDRTNMVYAGSQVTKGRARCIVTTTGMRTELGKIADALEREETSTKTGKALVLEKIKIALGLAGTTPLQIKLNALAYGLLVIAVILALIVVSSTGFKDIPESIATYAVAAAVSLLPASLVAVVSLTLAVACRDLAERNALVRKMDAVETLGGVHDICSDKTGTITVGRMVLKKAWIPTVASSIESTERATYNTKSGQMYNVESGQDPYYPRGTIRVIKSVKETEISSNETVPGVNDQEDPDADDMTANDIIRIDSLEPSFRDLVQSAALNNMATLRRGEENSPWTAVGDPTEIALQVFAHKAGFGKPHLTHVHNHQHANSLERVPTALSYSDVPKVKVDGHYEMLVEHPFDSTIKRMSTVWSFVPQDNGKDQDQYDLLAYMKGAVERILDRCSHVGLGEGRLALTSEIKEEIINHMDDMAAEGLRVLCLAAKHIPHDQIGTIKGLARDELEKDFCLLGLVGIYDPPRPESRGAVMDAHRAGIVPRMLTGDHAATAASIARSVGILDNTHGPWAVMTGQQFDALTDQQIDALPELPVVVARCAPETKVRMVEALHRRGRKTVMTGDGVNDSPALKRADVGVAMGLNGSDVAKGAADIVLADDNFSTIVRAIRKGRSVFQNLSKFLVYLLSGNVAEVVVLMIGLAFRRDGVAVYPIGPVAALWINTITTGPPALALGIEPTAKDAMDLGPEDFQGIFTPSWYLGTIGYGVFMGAQTLANFVIVQYGVAEGSDDILPICNEALVGLQPGCEIVFKARGTAFATLLLILMVHAITCKNMTRSMFQMKLLENKMLLWVVACLSLSLFPVLYIPEINHRVFQLDGLTWEWGLVFGQLILYVVASELYKLTRRKFARRRTIKKREGLDMHVAYTIDV